MKLSYGKSQGSGPWLACVSHPLGRRAVGSRVTSQYLRRHRFYFIILYLVLISGKNYRKPWFLPSNVAPNDGFV